MSSALHELLATMARLRAPDGCPWDREQTFATLARYTIEEAYELVDAIERGDLPHLRDELGDLLLQVVFHAQIAREGGHFDFDAVAAGITAKLKRRHPHLFADADVASASAGAVASAAEQLIAWENIKAEERRKARAAVAAGGSAEDARMPSQLDDVPRSLPALMRADKLSKRAARVGFDFDLADQAAAKVSEELAEVSAAAHANTDVAPSREVFEEVGDLLFAATNLARKLGVDAEAALREANAKFERRFRGMEAIAAARGLAFESLRLDEQERLWHEMKRRE
ncbi:MAG: nucleoside triphosphate pyrophosphohydrolase [Steroidobacteraceae bacterium]|jgi:MazG family protein